MDWSYRLLINAERQLFECLSVFAGGWDLDAAERVCASDEVSREQILELLGSLVGKSLVVVGEAPDGDSRFDYLETVREYGRIRLESRGLTQTDVTRHLHATYYAELVEQLNPDVLSFEADVRRLELEQDNIRSALMWCIENDHAALGLRLSIAMQSIWFVQGLYGEAWWWYDSLLKLADSRSQEAPIARAHDDVATPLQRAFALRGAAVVVGNIGDSARARALIEEAAAVMENLDRGSPFHAQTLALRGISEWIEGDVRSAMASAEEGLRYSRAAGAPAVTSVALQVLGYIALSQSRYEDAVELLTESERANPRHGWWSRNVEAELASLLARTYYLCGAYDKASIHFRKALEILRAEHIRSYVLGHCLEWYAVFECTLGWPADGAVLYGAAEAVWRAGGGVRWASWQVSYEREVAGLDSRLDSQQRDAVWRKGTRLSAEEAVDYALALNAAHGAVLSEQTCASPPR
jgi:non-specific serine/threonine protein kinase